MTIIMSREYIMKPNKSYIKLHGGMHILTCMCISHSLVRTHGSMHNSANGRLTRSSVYKQVNTCIYGCMPSRSQSNDSPLWL